MTITVSGTSITFNDATTQSTAATGTVTSVATGNGLSGGTITSTGTLVIAAPSSNSIGSYIWGWMNLSCNQQVVFGTNYAIGTGYNQIQWIDGNNGTISGSGTTTGLSGTWKWMGRTYTAGGCGGSSRAICVRVS
jgi:hypothetical protein